MAKTQAVNPINVTTLEKIARKINAKTIMIFFNEMILPETTKLTSINQNLEDVTQKTDVTPSTASPLSVIGMEQIAIKTNVKKVLILWITTSGQTMEEREFVKNKKNVMKDVKVINVTKQARSAMN